MIENSRDNCKKMQYERQRDCLAGEQLHCVQKSGGKVWYMLIPFHLQPLQLLPLL